jgi:nucleoside-diphosphate-sugar epimerase
MKHLFYVRVCFISQMEKRVCCVTGATGFLASHLVLQLLQQDFVVRATVRNPRDKTRVSHLLRMSEQFPGKLHLFEADLLKEGSFDEAIRGCNIVFHVAAPVTLTCSDPQKEVVDPSVKV